MGSEDWKQRAIDELERGGKRSDVRRAVVDKLAEQSCAVTAAHLTDLLNADGGPVGRATVYRVLEGLRDLHLVQRLDLGREGTRYEPARGADHHHHFVCDRCGDVLPFSDSGLERAISRLSKQATFAVSNHDVVLHGECGRCED